MMLPPSVLFILSTYVPQPDTFIAIPFASVARLDICPRHSILICKDLGVEISFNESGNRHSINILKDTCVD